MKTKYSTTKKNYEAKQTNEQKQQKNLPLC